LEESLEMRGADLARTIAGSIASMGVVLDPTASACADEPCARVVAPAELPAAWAGAVADLRQQIGQLPASDCQSMTLSLEPQEAGMRIVATTRDGRRAERTVRHSESLAAMALGVLMAIPGEHSEEAPVLGTSPAPRGPVPSEPRAAFLAAGPATVPAPRTIALWVGLSGGIRLTAPTSLSVLDVEARGDILFDRWLMLMTLRSALVSCLGQQGVDCDVYSDVSAGVGVGRRFRLGGPDIDVALEPSLVVMHMEYDLTAGAEGQTVEDTQVVLRLDASARLAVPFDQHWVLTVTLDGGLAPSMLANPTRLELPAGPAPRGQPPPPFPAWSGGLRLGASGALL
jgi:hypothetical protein